jgi:hypothetical protein
MGSPEGVCGFCGSLAVFFGLWVVPKASKAAVTDILSATEFASLLPPTGRENFENPLCLPSQNLRISRWGREMRWGVSANAFSLSAIRRSMARSCYSSAALHGGQGIPALPVLAVS